MGTSDQAFPLKHDEAPAPAPRAVRRQTVTMSTLEAIREKILTGESGEGTPLRQDALAKELGVSRIPVREALRQLEAEGLVTIKPHVGAVVSSLSIAEVKELFEIRALIEVELLRRAVPRIAAEDISRANDILDRYEAAFDRGDVAEWGALNFEFHASLYQPANQPLTMGIVSNLHNHSDRYLRMQLSLTRGQSRASEEHRAILAAVSRGDGPHACSLLNTHILDAGRSLLEFLSGRGDPRAESSE